jgi:tetratricopeptide (TPR) repeat protein
MTADAPFAALIDRALALHRAGDLSAARAGYEAVLRRDPANFDALHMLGLVLVQQGEGGRGAELIERAVAANPGVAAAHVNLAMALVALGRFEAALAASERALALQPASADAHINRGNALLALARPDEALAAYDAALALRPADPQAHYNRANALRDLGRLDAAVMGYDAAVALRPGYLEALSNRGAALLKLERLEEALASYDGAAAAAPASAEAHLNRGVVLARLNRLADAIASYDAAVAANPASPEAHSNRASALNDSNRPAEALAASDRALALKPDYPEAHNNRGIALYNLHRLEEARASYDRAVDLAPEAPEAHLNRALAALRAGDLAEGFAEYPWRWQVGEAARYRPRVSAPNWEGEPLAGRSILVFSEQGFGDGLQFVRYVPRVAAMAARVILLTEAPLARLFAAALPGVEVVNRLPEGAAFDRQVAMMCLPRLFGTTLASVPADMPYLAVDREAATGWAARLAALPPGPRVGLVWAGASRRHNPGASAIDARRSVSLAQLAPLAAAPGVQFVSLQVGEPAAEAREPPRGMSLTDWTGELRDFADTAALVAGLDLVITVDTAVAHLAGALGRPVWILSRYDGCWRWLKDREDSPWYPSARLFHQATPGAWDAVIARVAAALATLAKAG